MEHCIGLWMETIFLWGIFFKCWHRCSQLDILAAFTNQTKCFATCTCLKTNEELSSLNLFTGNYCSLFFPTAESSVLRRPISSETTVSKFQWSLIKQQRECLLVALLSVFPSYKTSANTHTQVCCMSLTQSIFFS